MDNPATPVARDASGIFGHPRGLTNLFFTELWERFGYYGMRALLTLFMVTEAAKGGMGYGTVRAGLIYGTYTMSVYMLSIPGGFIADNFIGARMTVFLGGCVIAAGYLTLAFHSTTTFYVGLVLVACGTGMLKPNISSMVGALYSKDDDRRDAGFSIFYMGINIGALSAPLLTGWLAQSSTYKAMLADWGFDPNRSWHWGFAAAGFGMIIGLVVYVIQRHRLAHVGNAPAPEVPRPWGGLGKVLIGTLVFLGYVILSDQDGYNWMRWLFIVLPVGATLWYGFNPDLEKKRMAAIFVFCIAAMVFWAIFEQAGSTIALFSDQLTDRSLPWNGEFNLFGWHLHFASPFPSAWFQSVNSFWVILLAGVFAWLWVKLGRRQPSSPLKFTIGLFFLGLSFVMMVPAAKLTADGKISSLWLVALFFLQTVGELCISPVGLSTMTKLAPARLAGLVMGLWFLAASLGNKLAGVLAGEFTATDAPALAHFFTKQAIWVGCAAVALLAVTPWVRKLMGQVH
jgi:POT family proton-dependent oligopeptide transporter